jgi:fatty acid desaturase
MGRAPRAAQSNYRVLPDVTVTYVDVTPRSAARADVAKQPFDNHPARLMLLLVITFWGLIAVGGLSAAGIVAWAMIASAFGR